MDIKKTKTTDLHYSHYITIAIPIPGGPDLLGLALESSPIELEILYLGDDCPLSWSQVMGALGTGLWKGAERGTYTVHEGFSQNFRWQERSEPDQRQCLALAWQGQVAASCYGRGWGQLKPAGEWFPLNAIIQT